MSTRPPMVTVMIHRDGTPESRTIRLPVWLVRVAVVLGSVVALLLVVGLALYTPIVRHAARVPALEREIAALREENQRVRQLAATLEAIEARYDQVRSMLGANVVPERVRLEGELPTTIPIVARPVAAGSRYEAARSVPRHWPLDDPGFVTRGPSPAGDADGGHSGLDIAVPTGSPIRASGGGVVANAGRDPEYGQFVLLEHPEQYQTMYGHASRLLVAPGDTVQAGQVIALSGSTGRSTAPHLHFEIRRGGRPIDPRTLMPEEH